MTGTISLQTQRLLLRRHVLEDAWLLYQNFGTDAAMYRYSGWNPYATLEQARETVQRFIDSYADPCHSGDGSGVTVPSVTRCTSAVNKACVNTNNIAKHILASTLP